MQSNDTTTNEEQPSMQKINGSHTAIQQRPKQITKPIHVQ